MSHHSLFFFLKKSNWINNTKSDSSRIRCAKDNHSTSYKGKVSYQNKNKNTKQKKRRKLLYNTHTK